MKKILIGLLIASVSLFAKDNNCIKPINEYKESDISKCKDYLKISDIVAMEINLGVDIYSSNFLKKRYILYIKKKG